MLKEFCDMCHKEITNKEKYTLLIKKNMLTFHNKGQEFKIRTYFKIENK